MKVRFNFASLASHGAICRENVGKQGGAIMVRILSATVVLCLATVSQAQIVHHAAEGIGKLAKFAGQALVALLFALFHQRVCGPLANSLFHHRPDETQKLASKIEAVSQTLPQMPSLSRDFH